jgi:hypothetical protein
MIKQLTLLQKGEVGTNLFLLILWAVFIISINVWFGLVSAIILL